MIIPAGKGRKSRSFDILTSEQQLEVLTTTNGPEIDQSQHVKSVGHIINYTRGPGCTNAG